MTKLGKTLALGAFILPGAALAQINVGDALGSTEADIRAALEAQGYAVSEFEIEGDEIEVEAMLDGAAWEIEVSAETGMVLEIELDDDGGDDGEDS